MRSIPFSATCPSASLVVMVNEEGEVFPPASIILPDGLYHLADGDNGQHGYFTVLHGSPSRAMLFDAIPAEPTTSSPAP